MKKYLLKCQVNGKNIEREIRPDKTLLEFIREDLGLTGTKEGCGEGECGACLVLLDGRAVNSCLMMAAQAHGKKIITIEGLRDEKNPLIDSFAKEAAVQCGFCIPGFIIKAEELLSENPEATDDEIKESLAGNLCRCTGYKNIIKAVGKVRKKCLK